MPQEGLYEGGQPQGHHYSGVAALEDMSAQPGRIFNYTGDCLFKQGFTVMALEQEVPRGSTLANHGGTMSGFMEDGDEKDDQTVLFVPSALATQRLLQAAKEKAGASQEGANQVVGSRKDDKPALPYVARSPAQLKMVRDDH